MGKHYLTRKEKIIISAIEILDQGGISGLTMKEIARQQGITEPAVYRQFNNKQEIILTILERFAAFDDTLINTVRQQDMEPDKAIEYFFSSYATYYENYPEIVTALFSYDVYRYEPDAKAIIRGIVEKRHDFIEEIVDKGVQQHAFAPDVSSATCAQMLLGALWSVMYQWKLDECEWGLKEGLMEQIQWMLKHMKKNAVSKLAMDTASRAKEAGHENSDRGR